MSRYNKDGRNSKFLIDSRQDFQLNKMKGIRRQDMKIKLDTDVSMGDDDGAQQSGSGHHHNRQQRGKKYNNNSRKHHGGGGGGNAGHGRGGGRRNKKWSNQKGGGRGGDGFVHELGSGWHKCAVIGGSELSRDVVLQTILTSLGNTTGVPFQPIAYTINPPNTVFFIENPKVAEGISKIKCDALKFRITAVGSPPPSAVTPLLEEKLSFELQSRLSPTGHLNLSNFHNTNAIALDYYLPLYRSSIGTLIGKLMLNWIGMINSVDLSFNRLITLESLSFLSNAGNIKAIIANDNKFRDIAALERVKSLPISELVLVNNPCSERHNDRNKYIQEVLKRFPNLQKLDLKPIEPSLHINFDIEKSKAPSPQKSWFCNESAKSVVQTFLTEYLRLYDSKREDLGNAYAENATMTLSCSYMKDNFHSSIVSASSAQKLSIYIGESRNLLTKQNKSSRKTRLVHVGRDEIIKFLCKLPQTKHEDYVIDMPVALEAFIIFTVNGIFREPLDKHAARHFNRTFTLVPLHGGFVIVNEMLFITNPTQEQIKSLSSSSNSRNVTHRVDSVVKPLMPLPLVTSELTQADKLRLFMEKSRMNQDWARKCLEENNWNFERSIFVFHELCKVGKIPAEAFQVSPFQ